MSRQIRIQPAADEDLDRHARYIAKDSVAAALRLYDQAQAAFSFLADTPFAGPRCNFKHSDVADLRVWRIKQFPNHLILYRATDDAVIIIRVVHAAQDWLDTFGLHDDN